jgi:integrase/recombinase XerD
MVPIGNVALHWIDRYVKEVHGLRTSEPLFYQPGGFNPIAGWFVAKIVCKYKSAAHLKNPCNIRSFRHSFAIHLLENGASIRHIQAMMGHASLKTTQKYTRIVPEELKRAHLRAHPAERRQGRLRLPKADPVRFADRRK